MKTNRQTTLASVDEWQRATAQVAQWAQHLDLAHPPHLSATESVEQLKIAATLAKSAGETTGAKSRRLRRSAADAAEKAAHLAQLVIIDLSEANKPEMRDQILAWSRAQLAADQLVQLSTQMIASTKAWWKFWQ